MQPGAIAAAAAPMVAVGAVNDRQARLWLRTDLDGPFTVEVGTDAGPPRSATIADRRAPDDDGTLAFTLPDDAPDIGPLAPATEHQFRIRAARTGEPIGEGRFETAPAEGTRASFAFAFMSCHQPFLPDGSVHPDSARMLAALGPALEARGVKYLLLIGDQIYADGPDRRRLLSADAEAPLLALSVEEIRARYQARYRRFWAFPQLRRLLARWPAWCMWDDHEIVDDWGARRKHQEPAWRKVFAGARRAFIDYQASRLMSVSSSSPLPLPSAFHHAFSWGSTATFVMDLSSQRSFDGRTAQVYGEDQLAALTAFLHEQRARPVVFIVLTVPLAYLPDWVVAVGERVPGQGEVFAARWNAARNRQALDRLLDVLKAHQHTAPGQKLVLLSGDVHEGAAVTMRWPDGKQIYQLVSSPVTNAVRDWKEHIAQRLAFSMRHVRHGSERVAIRRIAGVRPEQRNPFPGLNVGVVYVEDEGAGAQVRFELVTYDQRIPGAARAVYDTGPL